MAARNIIFKPLTKADLPLLHSWFQIQHVKEWYARNDDYPLDKIEEKYASRINNPLIPNFIIYDGDKLIGNIQLYNVSHNLPDGVEDYNHSLFSKYKTEKIAGVVRSD